MGYTRDSIIMYYRIYISLCMARRTTMINYIGIIGSVGLTLALVNFVFIIPMEQQLEHEKAINAYTVDQFNKMSTKAKQYKDRVEELENANDAMMQHCTPSSIVRAIKATPLPLMKG